MNASDSREHWFIYALGGGMGHLTRALALARAAVRSDLHRIGQPLRHVTILSNSPFAIHPLLLSDLDASCRIEAIPTDFTRDEVRDYVPRLLFETPIDTLFVDTFFRGIAGELTTVLPKLNCTKICIHRAIKLGYVHARDLQQSIGQYDRLLLPGETAVFESAVNAIRTNPWLIRDCTELLPRADAAKLLNVDPAEKTVCVIGCGRAGEAAEFATIADRLAASLPTGIHVRLANMFDTEPRHASAIDLAGNWPLLRLHRGIDLLVGSGGYNTVQESIATKTPLIALAQPRMYDDQASRLTQFQSASNADELLEKVLFFATNIQSEGNNDSTEVYFENGVYQACELIENLTKA